MRTNSRTARTYLFCVRTGNTPTGYLYAKNYPLRGNFARKNTPYARKKYPLWGIFRGFFFEKNTPYAAFFGEKIPPMQVDFSPKSTKNRRFLVV